MKFSGTNGGWVKTYFEVDVNGIEDDDQALVNDTEDQDEVPLLPMVMDSDSEKDED